MVAARRAAAFGALGVLAAVAMSCVALVGADEERERVTEAFCKCELDFLDGTCKQVIEERLGLVSPETRGAWMQAAEAKGCFVNCTKTLECYRTPPTCSKTDCYSGDTNECCPGFVCDVGTQRCNEEE